MKISAKTLAAALLYLAMPSEAEAKKYPECYFVEACGKEQIAKLQDALDEIKYFTSAPNGEITLVNQLDFDKFNCVYVDLPAKTAQKVKAEINGEFVWLPDFKFNHIAYPYEKCQREEYPHQDMGELQQYIRNYLDQLSLSEWAWWGGICFSGTNCWGGTNQAIVAPLRSSEPQSASTTTDYPSPQNVEQVTITPTSLHQHGLTVPYCDYGILFSAITSSLWGEELRKEGLLKKPLVYNAAEDLTEDTSESSVQFWDLYCDPDGTVSVDYETLRKDAENPQKVDLWGYQINQPESVRVFLSEGKQLTCIGPKNPLVEDFIHDCDIFPIYDIKQFHHCDKVYQEWKETRYNWFICGPEER